MAEPARNMADAQPSPQPNFISAQAAALKAIWADASAGRFAPPRDAIKLAMIRRMAQWFWLTDVVNSGEDYRFRIAGAQVEQFFGRSLRNSLLSELKDAHFAQRIRMDYMHCLDRRAPVQMGPEISEYEDKNYWEIAAIVLPLSDDGQTVTNLMGVFEFWPVGTHLELSQALPFCSPIFSA